MDRIIGGKVEVPKCQWFQIEHARMGDVDGWKGDRAARYGLERE